MKTDLSYLEELSGNAPNIMIEMIEIFFAQVDEFSEEMDAYLENKKWLELSQLAHKAKSSVSIMGMHEQAKDLKSLELMAKEENEVDKYPEYISKFKADCQEAIIELKTYIEKLK